MTNTTAPCPHLEQPGSTPPASAVCDECGALGDRWVHGEPGERRLWGAVVELAVE